MRVTSGVNVGMIAAAKYLDEQTHHTDSINASAASTVIKSVVLHASLMSILPSLPQARATRILTRENRAVGVAFSRFPEKSGTQI